jgi:hypothetical protein
MDHLDKRQTVTAKIAAKTNTTKISHLNRGFSIVRGASLTSRSETKKLLRQRHLLQEFNSFLD